MTEPATVNLNALKKTLRGKWPAKGEGETLGGRIRQRCTGGRPNTPFDPEEPPASRIGSTHPGNSDALPVHVLLNTLRRGWVSTGRTASTLRNRKDY